ncbi:hypothetical protein V494_01798 [Pseudogymnoascus sp. VKM F-4513 (FW-928)]|nr:hypothetical protein V494_01798 [Pseudogymnoascus sp. VKM F-4513 (FW-928)]
MARNRKILTVSPSFAFGGLLQTGGNLGAFRNEMSLRAYNKPSTPRRFTFSGFPANRMALYAHGKPVLRVMIRGNYDIMALRTVMQNLTGEPKNSSCLAFPAEHSSSSDAAKFSNFLPPNPFSKSVETKGPIANGAPLRVLCLGASIMGGHQSTNKNGMRYALRSALASHGNKVDMIGSIHLGAMDDNRVEAWPGYRIEQVAKKAELSLSKLPNVVAILAGTNDAGQGFDTPNMANRMAALIDRIFAVATGTTIVVGALPPMYEPADDIVRQYNRDLADLVSKRSAAGQKIFLADMHSPWWSLADLTKDKVHPTDAGYLKMARVFYDEIIAASNSITPPRTPPSSIKGHSPPNVVGHDPTTKDRTSGSIIGLTQTPQGPTPALSSVSTLSTNQAKLISSQSTSHHTTVTTHPASSLQSSSSHHSTATTHPAPPLGSGSSHHSTVTTHPAPPLGSGSSNHSTATTHPAPPLGSGSSHHYTATTHPAPPLGSGSSHYTTVTTHPAPPLGSGSSHYTTVTTHPTPPLGSSSSYPATVTTRPASSSEYSSCQDSLNDCLTSPGANLSTCQENFAACQGSLVSTQPTFVGTNSTSDLPSATTSKTPIFSGAASFAKPAAGFLALGAFAFF